MTSQSITTEDLAILLQDAEAAHAACERGLGHRSERWAAWYAAFLVKRLQESIEMSTKGGAHGTAP